MEDNITKLDLDKVISHLKTKNPILTAGKNVKKFEEEWSKWLGVKYSVFVNSGSSANFLTIACLKEMGLKGEIILPSLIPKATANPESSNRTLFCFCAILNKPAS